MALKPTIYKLQLNLADMNRDLYCNEKLTIALHPSETEQRMLVRILAYALNYDQGLSFSRGLSATDEPDLWLKDDAGVVKRWIEVGQASADRLRKAVSRAEGVFLYAYGAETEIWWHKHSGDILQLPKCEIFAFDAEELEDATSLCQRNMELTVTISEQQLFLSDAEQHFTVSFRKLG